MRKLREFDLVKAAAITAHFIFTPFMFIFMLFWVLYFVHGSDMMHFLRNLFFVFMISSAFVSFTLATIAFFSDLRE